MVSTYDRMLDSSGAAAAALAALVLGSLFSAAPLRAAEEAAGEATARETTAGEPTAGETEGDIDAEGHLAVITFGATGERELADRFTHVGPAIGIEVEPVEHWLEIELAASGYERHRVKGFSLEMPFKTPFELAEGLEVMPGIGPTWTHTAEDGAVSRVWGATAVVDLFYWPTRKAGWYLAPSYGYTFGSTRQKSVALSFGVFFAVP